MANLSSRAHAGVDIVAVTIPSVIAAILTPLWACDDGPANDGGTGQMATKCT